MTRKKKRKKPGFNIILNRHFTACYNRRWLLGCLLFFSVLACKSRSTGTETALQARLRENTLARQQQSLLAIRTAKPLVQQGDIITRTGIDFTSESLRRLCLKDPTYSHCGIISIEQDTVFVYHALGGEINPDQKLKKETLAAFCDGTDNKGFGIFRLPLSAAIHTRVDSLLHGYYAAGLPFDMDFDLQTDDKMYCSEFVYKVFSKAFRQPRLFTTTTVGQKEYVGVDDIFLQKQCREIRRFAY